MSLGHQSATLMTFSKNNWRALDIPGNLPKHRHLGFKSWDCLIQHYAHTSNKLTNLPHKEFIRVKHILNEANITHQI